MVREFDFTKMVPGQWTRDSEDLEGFLQDLQQSFTDILVDVDRLPDIASIDRAPDGSDPTHGSTDFVDVLLAHLGNPFDLAFRATTPEKRRLLALLVPLYRQKGTCIGVENAVRVLTGFDAACLVISETFAAWQLDKSFLGVDTYLYGTEEDLWGFELWVSGTLTQEDRDRIAEIVNYMKPLEARLVQIIQGTVKDSLMRADVRGRIEKDSLFRFDLEV